MSRDDSVLDQAPTPGMLRSGGLKGRLRRALSFNPTLKEEDNSDDESIKASTYTSASKQKAKSSTEHTSSAAKSNGTNGVSSATDNNTDDAASTATVQTKKKSRAASLFNARFNASTDNISLSSTVSSASVMIRKLGSMGKLARRNSLAGITSLFKDKDKDKSKKKDKKGSSSKSEASEASVSHVTAELDRTGADWNSPEMNGLSPAAKLARQHTLKTNAESAARAKAQQEAATKAAAESANGANGAGVPTWDKNTATRQVTSPPKGGNFRINEDGSRVLVEDDDEDSEDGHHGAPSQQAGTGFNQERWEEDEEWDQDNEDDEDTTIRVGMGRTSLEDPEDDLEPWGTHLRRSEERTRQPSKGILKSLYLSFFFRYSTLTLMFRC
jgi:hypothetical protein